MLPNNPSPLGSRVSPKTERGARGCVGGWCGGVVVVVGGRVRVEDGRREERGEHCRAQERGLWVLLWLLWLLYYYNDVLGAARERENIGLSDCYLEIGGILSSYNYHYGAHHYHFIIIVL